MNQPRRKKNKFKRFSVKINAEFYFVVKVISALKRVSLSQVITESFYNTFQPHYLFINAWQYQDVTQQVTNVEICLNRLNGSIHTIRHLLNKYERARTDVPYVESDAYNKAIRYLNSCQKVVKQASRNFDNFYAVFSRRFYLSSSLGHRHISSNIKHRIRKLVIKSNQLRHIAPVEPPKVIHIRIPIALYNLIHKYHSKYKAGYKYIVEEAIMSIRHLPYIIVPIEDLAYPKLLHMLTPKEAVHQSDFQYFYVQLDLVMKVSNEVSGTHMNFLKSLIDLLSSHEKIILAQHDSSAYFNEAVKMESKITPHVVILRDALNKLALLTHKLK